jgi:hypothetical protein
MIGEIVMAMKHRIGLGKIASVIHPYPTQAEAVRKLGDQFNRTKLTPVNIRRSSENVQLIWRGLGVFLIAEHYECFAIRIRRRL